MVAYENASRALYVAKQCGKGCYYCHRPEDDEENGKAAESVDLRQLVSILRDREKPRGGMNVAYPQFSKVYDFISNLAERNKQKVRIILFTVHEADGVTLTGEDRDVVMGMLETAIRDSIRNVDASTRYSTMQRVVLLMNLNDEQTEKVVKRILDGFDRMCDRKDIEIRHDSADLSRSN